MVEGGVEARNLRCHHASCNIIPLNCVVGRVAPCGPLVCLFVSSILPSFVGERSLVHQGVEFGMVWYSMCKMDGCVVVG